jgi:AraC-like DNA-binding protein
MKIIPVRRIKKPENETGLSEGFRIRRIEDVLSGQDMIQDIHRHDFFFILALERGNGEHVIDFTPYKIEDHSVFFMRPGQAHQLALKKNCRGYLIEFTADFYYPHEEASKHLLRKASNNNHCRLSANNSNRLLSLLTEIYQEYTDRKEAYQEVIKASLKIFFIELVRQRQQSIDTARNKKQNTQERLEDFLELLETHVAKHKLVSEYAAMLNLSSYQLNAITRANLGKNSSEVINEFIILESKRYLLATPNQVKEIAYHLGYDDVSYFIRFFKKHTGYSPETFRQKFK